SRLHAAAARRARRGEAARRLTGARALAGDRAGAHRRHRRLLPAPAPGEWARRAAGRDQDVRARHPRRAEAHDVAASGGGDVAILLLCAPAMALTAVQVAWLAGWVGATRRGRLLAALLFALGTQAFQFGTMLTKESLTALAITSAVRLALGDGDAWRRTGAGV